MLKDKNNIICAVSIMLLFSSMAGSGQTRSAQSYPQKYFRNPLGFPMELTANFGELRSTHWHMGLDLRTRQRVDQPVFAAASGYISHVGIRSMSFGRFMIIRHPNGYSTLYAHLNRFFPELEQYVLQEQHEKQTWSIELGFNENQFPVNQGDQIGLSGSTGSSQGPHLHFEIIDTRTGRSMNPLLFGFDLKDDIPPVITKLAVYNREKSTLMQEPLVINLVKTGRGYITRPERIRVKNQKISFAFSAYDKVNGGVGKEGIFAATLFVDHVAQVGFLLDNLTYPESDYINAHTDHLSRNRNGESFQHLSKLPGYRGPVYTEYSGNGVLHLKDTLPHTVRIDVRDAYDNLSQLFFEIQYQPDSVKTLSSEKRLRVLIPRLVSIIEENHFEVYIPETGLYDTIPYFYSRQNNFSPGSVSDLHRFSDPEYPLHGFIAVRIKPTRELGREERKKVVMTRESGGQISTRLAEWQSGWFAAEFGAFGNFQLFIDTIPPQINAPAKGTDTLDLSSLKQIIFTPKDPSGIRSFRAELNGKWLMFLNDKSRNFVYQFDEQFPYGTHELKVKAEDIAGNLAEATWWVKRQPYQPPKKRSR